MLEAEAVTMRRARGVRGFWVAGFKFQCKDKQCEGPFRCEFHSPVKDDVRKYQVKEPIWCEEQGHSTGQPCRMERKYKHIEYRPTPGGRKFKRTKVYEQDFVAEESTLPGFG